MYLLNDTTLSTWVEYNYSVSYAYASSTTETPDIDVRLSRKDITLWNRCQFRCMATLIPDLDRRGKCNMFTLHNMVKSTYSMQMIKRGCMHPSTFKLVCTRHFWSPCSPRQAQNICTHSEVWKRGNPCLWEVDLSCRSYQKRITSGYGRGVVGHSICVVFPITFMLVGSKSFNSSHSEILGSKHLQKHCLSIKLCDLILLW